MRFTLNQELFFHLVGTEITASRHFSRECNFGKAANLYTSLIGHHYDDLEFLKRFTGTEYKDIQRIKDAQELEKEKIAEHKSALESAISNSLFDPVIKEKATEDAEAKYYPEIGAISANGEKLQKIVTFRKVGFRNGDVRILLCLVGSQVKRELKEELATLLEIYKNDRYFTFDESDKFPPLKIVNKHTFHLIDRALAQASEHQKNYEGLLLAEKEIINHGTYQPVKRVNKVVDAYQDVVATYGKGEKLKFYTDKVLTYYHIKGYEDKERAVAVSMIKDGVKYHYYKLGN